jgi:hypothetical protein
MSLGNDAIDANRCRTDSISSLAGLLNSDQRQRAGCEELRIRNAIASWCIRACAARSSHFYRAEFIPKFFANRRSIVFTDLAMMLDLLEMEMGKVTCSISYSEQPQLLPLYAQLFRHPPRKMAGCSGENLSKTESMIETMADGQGKIMAQREVAQAQDALLSGKMGACAAHLTNAMHVGGMTK